MGSCGWCGGEKEGSWRELSGRVSETEAGKRFNGERTGWVWVAVGQG